MVLQVTLSKFHALNFKVGSFLPFWTLLKKVHSWRSISAGTWVAETENAEGEDLDAKMGDGTGETESVKQNPTPRDDTVQGL